MDDINNKHEIIMGQKQEILYLKNKTISYIIKDYNMIIDEDNYTLNNYREYSDKYKETLYKYLDTNKVDSIFHIKEIYFSKLKKDIPTVENKGFFYTKQKYQKDIKKHINIQDHYLEKELKINNIILNEINDEIMNIEKDIVIHNNIIKKEIYLKETQLHSLVIVFILVNITLLILLSFDFKKIKKQLSRKKFFIDNMVDNQD